MAHPCHAARPCTWCIPVALHIPTRGTSLLPCLWQRAEGAAAPTTFQIKTRAAPAHLRGHPAWALVADPQGTAGQWVPWDLWGSPGPRMARDHGHTSAAGTAQAVGRGHQPVPTPLHRSAAGTPSPPQHHQHLCCTVPGDSGGRQCPGGTSLAACWGVERAGTSRGSRGEL